MGKIKKKILKLHLFKYFYIFTSIILKPFKSKNKMLFYSTPDLSDNAWALFHYTINNRNNLKVIWLCDNLNYSKEKIKQLNLNNNKVVLVKKESVFGLLHFITSAVAFTTTVFYPFVKKGYGPICINLWHGMPIKKIGSYIGDENIGDYYSYTISTSTFYSSIMSKSLNIKLENILPIGLPKNDLLILPTTLNKNELFDYFKIPIKTQLIFWLPTFRKANQKKFISDSYSTSFLAEWQDLDIENLNSILKKENKSIVIKLHPMDSLNESQELNSLSNIIFITNKDWLSSKFDLYEALSFSDALISDISSVLIDYLVTKRPIAITKRFIKNYKRGLITESAEILNSFYSINNPENFTYFIKNFNLIKPLDNDFYSKYNVQAIQRNISSKSILEFLHL